MGTDELQFQVEQYDIYYTGALETPRVHLLSLESGVLDLLLQHLGPFGATIENAGYNPSWSNLAQAYLEMKFLGGYGFCRLWPNVLELRFQKPPSLTAGSPRDQTSQLLAGAISALQSADESIRLTSHSFTVSLHGRLIGESVEDFLRRFVKDPPLTSGATLGLGVRYTFEPDAEGRVASLRLEPSESLQPDGLFVELGVTFDTEFSDPTSHAADYIDTLVSRLDFPVEVL